MEIIPVTYGKSTLPESMIFSGGNQNKVRDIVFKVFVIKSDNRTILIDAGCETMPGFDMVDFAGTVNALKNTGISTDDITDVIITHAHHDHIECVRYFDKSLIHIQRLEYEKGKKYFTDSLNVNLFDEEYEVCDSVKAIKIGGHSEGSCIVQVLKDNKKYIISGDECYLKECLTQNIPTGYSYNPEKSKEFILKYRTEEYEVLLCHDN